MPLQTRLKKAKLVLFDFDGLLVDTEALQFASYKEALQANGFTLAVDFQTYLKLAHAPSGRGLQEYVFTQDPSFSKEWEALRKEKATAYLALLEKGSISLTKGAAPLIALFAQRNIPMCVATNSKKVEIDLLRQRLPELNQIPVWITREDYLKAKPEPDSYQKALSYFPNITLSDAIGFEDSLRGREALVRAGIFPILIPDQFHAPLQEGILSLPSLQAAVDLLDSYTESH